MSKVTLVGGPEDGQEFTPEPGFGILRYDSKRGHGIYAKNLQRDPSGAKWFWRPDWEGMKRPKWLGPQ